MPHNKQQSEIDIDRMIREVLSKHYSSWDSDIITEFHNLIENLTHSIHDKAYEAGKRETVEKLSVQIKKSIDLLGETLSAKKIKETNLSYHGRRAVMQTKICLLADFFV